MDPYGAAIFLAFAVGGVAACALVLYAFFLLEQRSRARTLVVPPEPRAPRERKHGRTRPVELHELDALIAATPALVIHCWASWNSMDWWLDQSWGEVLPRWRDRLVVRSFDVDPPAHHERLREWKVIGVPGTVCFRDGAHVATKCHFMTPEELEAVLTELYGPTPIRTDR